MQIFLSRYLPVLLLALVYTAPAAAFQSDTLQLDQVFDLEYASDPQISPSGDRVVYVRNSMNIMEDRGRSNLWIIGTDGSGNRPLTSGNSSARSPRWSPDGSRLLYVSGTDDGAELHLRWMESGETAQISHLTQSPSGISWSPDGSRIAFTMFVPESSGGPMVSLPGQPEGAEWADPAIVIDEMRYRADGRGYLRDGYTHLFVMPAEGGTPRQLTEGPYNHGGTPQWTADGEALLISANRHENRKFEPANSEIYRISVADGSITALTDRMGPDSGPVLSPDGSMIAYTGYDEEYMGYQPSQVWIMDSDGGNPRRILQDLDRSPSGLQWSGDRLWLEYDDEGNTKIASASPDGDMTVVAENLGGTGIGRPYGGGSFTVNSAGDYAYTYTRPEFPADLAVGRGSGEPERITRLNEELFSHTELGTTEEIWYESSHDGRQIHGWIVKPPGFDPEQQYPLILEIHGGPFSNYGPRFSAEVQLYAAAGYVVLYTNPRGSTSYGREFGNLIHHNYPNRDYDDLMSGVDAVLEQGYVDEERLFITGGSGGGVLTAWTIGKTDRFRAAVVAKPVINWYSFVLTADNPAFFHRYWFPGLPWEETEHYMERSPISLVGNVTTPTMLLTGEEDYRTPMSETEQYYTALQLQKVEAVMVRIPGAGHGITARPSNLMSKVAHILEWFDRHD